MLSKTRTLGLCCSQNDCRLTTVANQQQLDKIVIVLPSSGGSHVGGCTRATCGHDNAAVLSVNFSSPKASICQMRPRLICDLQ